MSDMIERIARAIYEAPYASSSEAGWWAVPEDKKTGYRLLAITVLKALLEPTPEMVEAAWLREPFADEDATSIYRAMIRAAAGEPSHD